MSDGAYSMPNVPQRFYEAWETRHHSTKRGKSEQSGLPYNAELQEQEREAAWQQSGHCACAKCGWRSELLPLADARMAFLRHRCER